MADTITIRTDDETDHALDVLTHGGISRSAAIRQAVLEAASRRERAAGSTGMTLAVTAGGKDYFYPGGGTSAATPLWAALIALADQYSGHRLGFVNPDIYRIGRGASYHQAFHDITTGNSTVTFGQAKMTGYSALPGWDPVTGWGSPDAQALIPLLALHQRLSSASIDWAKEALVKLLLHQYRGV